MTDLTSKNNCVTLELTKAQIKFLEYCKEFGWGKLEVTIKNGEPVMSNIVIRDSVLRHDMKFD